MRRVVLGGLRALAALGIGLVALEVGTCFAVRGGLLSTPAPHYGRTGIWLPDHPQVGVWHKPNTHGRVAGDCYAADYHINSAGARDVERYAPAEEPRVVVLGDSFLEGWGLPATARLSNRLERETGVPHLNFAMAHFGPYQQVRLYRLLANQWEHHAVLASLVPINDLVDADIELMRKFTALYRYHRYRPYLVEGPEGFRTFHYVEPPLRRWLRVHTYGFGALQEASFLLFPGDDAGLSAPSADRPHSFFYDFEERQAVLLEEIYRRLAEEAGPRPLAVLMIPTQTDLARHAIEGASPLAARMRLAAERGGWHLVDLLPPMAAHTREWSSYFFTCDYHWGPFGNQVAAELVREDLEGILYGAGSATAAD